MCDNHDDFQMVYPKGKRSTIRSMGSAYRFNPNFGYVNTPFTIGSTNVSKYARTKRPHVHNVKVWAIPYWKPKYTGESIRFLVGVFGDGSREVCPIGGSIEESLEDFNGLTDNFSKNKLLIQNMHREMREEAGITQIDLSTHTKVLTYCYRWIDGVHVCTATVYFVDISDMIASITDETAFIRVTGSSEFKDNELETIKFLSMSDLMSMSGSSRMWSVFGCFVQSRIFKQACQIISKQ
jgi:8-oxo-dGTP pyrophosphatase MutT (NUDIX family)